MRESNIIRNAHNEYPIHANVGLQYAFYREILDWVSALFERYLEIHSRVYFIRFDVKFPLDLGYTPTNYEFEGFIKHLVARLGIRGSRLDPKYLWVMEQAAGEHHHYHAFLLLNGNRVQSIYNVMNLATEIWNGVLGLPADRDGLVTYCRVDRHGMTHDNGIMIRRDEPGSEADIKNCYTWAAYLAKSMYKNNVEGHVRQFGHSVVQKLSIQED